MFFIHFFNVKYGRIFEKHFNTFLYTLGSVVIINLLYLMMVDLSRHNDKYKQDEIKNLEYQLGKNTSFKDDVIIINNVSRVSLNNVSEIINKEINFKGLENLEFYLDKKTNDLDNTFTCYYNNSLKCENKTQKFDFDVDVNNIKISNISYLEAIEFNKYKNTELYLKESVKNNIENFGEKMKYILLILFFSIYYIIFNFRKIFKEIDKQD